MSDLIVQPLRDQSLYDELDKEFGIDVRELHDKARRIAERAKYCRRKYNREMLEDGLITMRPMVLYKILPEHNEPIPSGLPNRIDHWDSACLPNRIDHWDSACIHRELLDGACRGIFEESVNKTVCVPAQLVVDIIDFQLEKKRRKRMFSIDWAQPEPKSISIRTIGHWTKVEKSTEKCGGKRDPVESVQRDSVYRNHKSRKDVGCTTCVHMKKMNSGGVIEYWCDNPGGIVDYSDGNKRCRHRQQPISPLATGLDPEKAKVK